MSETIALRMVDGPLADQTFMPRAADVGWPPPELIELLGATYQRVRYSQLTEPIPGVIRGAEYEHRPPEAAS